MEENRALLQRWIDESSRIVFFGGAGVSTESGIPDFRSVDGLYNQQYDYPPETILSHTFYEARPEEFFRFYRNKMLFPDAQPNAAHKKLAELEQAGKLTAVVTQNIDGLHQKAGSKNVLELHGSVLRNYCEKCGKFFSLEDVMALEDNPNATEEERNIGMPLEPGCGETIRRDGLTHYIGSLKSEDGVVRVRVMCSMNIPHWPTPEMSRQAFEFFSHFSRDPETKESVYQE